MVFNKKIKGQAAIEFLMTYGWMLLVVLIVGALIFSFVDFGSLLPNKIDLNNNVRGSATDSFALAGPGPGNVVIVFTYTGANRVTMDANHSVIKRTDSTEDCIGNTIRNVETESEGASGTPVTFLNGQTGILRMTCGVDDLLFGDVLEGQFTINVTNIKTSLATPTTGPLRLTITE